MPVVMKGHVDHVCAQVLEEIITIETCYKTRNPLMMKLNNAETTQ